MGLLSPLGRWREAGLLLCECEQGHGCQRALHLAHCWAPGAPPLRWPWAAPMFVLRPSCYIPPVWQQAGSPLPQGVTPVSSHCLVILRGRRDFEPPASPQCIPSALRAAGGGRVQFLSCSEKKSYEAWLLFHLDLLSALTSSVSWLLRYCQPCLMLLI